METTINLEMLQPGEAATIAAVHAENPLHRRLVALGFRVGKPIEMIRHGRFHGPVQVRIGATDIMLRRKDAQKIKVNPLSP